VSLTHDQARLLALCKIKGANWYLLAREAQRVDGLDRLSAGEVIETSKEALDTAAAIRTAVPELPRLELEAEREYEKARKVGAWLVTVLDENYPVNLRLIFNLPPFLFVRGALQEDDLRSVAVVGARQASEVGVKRARRMARLLTERGVTVISGLARGIDTAAHTATLDAGGRTIAVIGTGIRRTYPAENAALADRIAENGAVVSQFWPDGPPASYTFPRRNVTMSGIAQGTVVIEASHTSGARMQARHAVEHGKKVFLLKSLTEEQAWARNFVETRGAHRVDGVDDVVRLLVEPSRVHAADSRRAQLALPF
jgi:DNA processing protein